MTGASVCLWFTPDEVQRALDLYCELVPDTRVVRHQHFDNPAGEEYSADVYRIEIAGVPYVVMAADRHEGFSGAQSMWLVVEDQEQLDRVWDGFLAAGGEEQACGWIKDPFGLSWQVLPEAFERLTGAGDEAQAQRVVEAVWQMTRISVAGLERAATDAL